MKRFVFSVADGPRTEQEFRTKAEARKHAKQLQKQYGKSIRMLDEKNRPYFFRNPGDPKFRHEDVASVPVGWKVRTVSHGDHRVRIAFPPGRRHKGSGRVVSILHPLGDNPCNARSSNPAELLVMSANNPPRRRNAGTRLERQRAARERAATIRRASGRNPARYRVVAVPRWGGDPLTWKFDTREAAKAHAKTLSSETYFKPHVQKIRESAENPVSELIVMGANPRVEVVSSPNPPTEEIVEEFTGREVEYLDVYNEPHMPRGRYAKLGPLIALYIKPAKGGQVQRIGASEAVGHEFPKAWGGKPPLVVCDSSAKQIYFVDGSQDITACVAAFTDEMVDVNPPPGQTYLVTLGQARRIDYQCRKEHVAAPDEDLWKHEHGDENGVLPTVLFDTKNKRLLYEGGDYRIEGPWIRN